MSVLEKIMKASYDAAIHNKHFDTYEVTAEEYKSLILETMKYCLNEEPQAPTSKTYSRNGFFTSETIHEVDHHAPIYLKRHTDWEKRRNNVLQNDMIVNTPSGPVKIVIKL